MAFACSSYNVENLWTSIRPKGTNFDCRNDDEEMTKVALLLKATNEVVTEIRQSQLSTASQLAHTTKQLESTTEQKEQIELQAAAFKKEIEILKNELQSSCAKGRRIQKEADLVAVKYERLQSNISAQVGKKLRAMFDSFLQQNRDGTAWDMMTQMYLETQLPDQDAPHPHNIAKLKFSSVNKDVVLSSPDTIPLTPDVQKTAQGALKSSRIKTKPYQPVISHSSSSPSSPEIIAGTPTPPPTFQKKDNKSRRDKILRILEIENDESKINSQTLSIVRDTENKNESILLEAKGTSSKIPSMSETLDSVNCEGERNMGENFPNKEEKENQNISKSNDVKLMADLSLDAEFPTTPKKISQPREKSPILGMSGSKKNSSSCKNPIQPQGCLPLSELSVSQPRTSSPRINNMELDISKATPKRAGKKTKKQIQPSIKASFLKANKSKLSLNRSKTDISKKPEFNGGQRSGKDLSVNLSHLSEKDQVDLAIVNSMEGNSHSSLLEDSDVTIFEPLLREKGVIEEKAMATALFSPKHHLPKIANKKGSLSSSSPRLFNPLLTSTMKNEAVHTKRNSPTGSEVDHAIGKPLFSSTEKAPGGNSLIHELAACLDENNFEDSVPYPIETSYDHIPKAPTSPDFVYDGPTVRNKNQRKNLAAIECKKCGEFFDLAFGDDLVAKKAAIDDCTRHRGRFPRSNTPHDYWNPHVPDTQYIRKQQLLPTT